MAKVQTKATLRKEGEEDVEFGAFTHNFADDACMLVGTHEDASLVAKEFNLHTRKFRSKVHVATAANPISKSVAVHMPATTRTKTAHARTWANEEETEWINYVKKSSYLGAYITTELKDDEEIMGRIQKALAMSGCLRKHLLASKDVWHAVKKKVLAGMILPIVLDGAESWVVSAMAMKELRSAFIRVARGCCRVSPRTTRNTGLRRKAFKKDWEWVHWSITSTGENSGTLVTSCGWTRTDYQN
jgi:hypothetical protein